MPRFDWTPDLSVGIPSIDRQHKMLVDYINRLDAAMSAGASAIELRAILDGLTKYAAAHFVYEELVFDTHHWPDSAQHKVMHENLGERVAGFVTRFNTGDRSVGHDLLDFLVSWLQTHIVKQDMQYARYFAAQRIVAA